LLFVLRDVDESELLADAGPDLARAGPRPETGKLLGEGDVAALFGLEMADAAPAETPPWPAARPAPAIKQDKPGKRAPAPAPAPAKSAPRRRTRGKRLAKGKGELLARRMAKKKRAEPKTKPRAKPSA
jgi:hypothetical protein